VTENVYLCAERKPLRDPFGSGDRTPQRQKLPG
jgi:hypothetical protein